MIKKKHIHTHKSHPIAPLCPPPTRPFAHRPPPTLPSRRPRSISHGRPRRPPVKGPQPASKDRGLCLLLPVYWRLFAFWFFFFCVCRFLHLPWFVCCLFVCLLLDGFYLSYFFISLSLV